MPSRPATRRPRTVVLPLTAGVGVLLSGCTALSSGYAPPVTVTAEITEPAIRTPVETTTRTETPRQPPQRRPVGPSDSAQDASGHSSVQV